MNLYKVFTYMQFGRKKKYALENIRKKKYAQERFWKKNVRPGFCFGQKMYALKAPCTGTI